MCRKGMIYKKDVRYPRLFPLNYIKTTLSHYLLAVSHF